LRKLAVWLDGLLTFERAESVLEKVGHLTMSDTTAWRQAQACGAQAQALETAQRAAATAAPDRQQVVPGEARSAERLALAMDGGMLPVRGEGFKELKVGGLGRIELAPARDPVTGDLLELARMVDNSYVAHLGGPATFGQQVWAEAKARRWSHAADTVVLGDLHLRCRQVWGAVDLEPGRRTFLRQHSNCRLVSRQRALEPGGQPAAW
jgi:hypothetical protein